MFQIRINWVSLLLAWGLIVGHCPRCFGQQNDSILLHRQLLLNQNVSQLSEAGKYYDAIPAAEELVKVVRKRFGPEHSDVAACLNNLALLYVKTGDYVKAIGLYQQAFQIATKTLGLEDPQTAM